MGFLPPVHVPHQGGVWLPVAMPATRSGTNYHPAVGFPSTSPQPSIHYSPHGMYSPLPQPVPSQTYPIQGVPIQASFRNLSEFSTGTTSQGFQGRQPPPHQKTIFL
ncbi:hypothetical protein [Phaffia rhodozyma]|uniref:Uncharacterized protein n=1 Tax=Phaffia rhodozyma TaxID=264483 RepID=A0A0F7SXR8_PHARH|nr:hypothetical protein [Phaffia rhodozyma]